MPLGWNLFFELRYDNNGNKIEDFIFNNEPYSNSKILITGKNFDKHFLIEPDPGWKNYNAVIKKRNKLAKLYIKNTSIDTSASLGKSKRIVVFGLKGFG